MRKSVFAFAFFISMLFFWSCSSVAEESLEEINYNKYQSALKYLLDQVGFRDSLSGHREEVCNFVLVPKVGCSTCIRRFQSLLNEPLQSQTYIFSEIELESALNPIYLVEDNLLMRLNLKTQSGMVWVKYRNEQIEYIEQITAFNIDSVVNDLTLGAVLGENQ